MSERRSRRTEMANLVRDAVQFRGLDDDARDVARLIGVQFRERLRETQSAGRSAAGLVIDGARPVVRRTANRATSAAGSVADSVAERTRPIAGKAAEQASENASRAARRGSSVAADAARRGSAAAADAARRGSAVSGDAARRGSSIAADAARRGSIIAAAAGAEALRRADPIVRDTADDVRAAVRALTSSRSARPLAIGGIAGALAATAMGGAMLAAREAGLMSETPPKAITEKALKKAGKKAAKTAKSGRRKHADVASAGNGDGTAGDEAGNAGGAAGEAVQAAPDQAFDVAATALHIGFGAALGAGFGLLHAQLPAEWQTPLPTVGGSLALATAVWAVSYAGWVPALELMPPPSKDEPGRQATTIAAHLLFGAILGTALVAGLRTAD